MESRALHLTEGPLVETPFDGDSYLRLVRHQAEKIPSLLVANVPVLPNGPRTVELENIRTAMLCQDSFDVHWKCLPCSDSIPIVLGSFEALQKTLKKTRSNGQVPDSEGETRWKDILDQSTPTLGWVSGLSHRMTIRLVQYHSIWLSRSSHLSFETGRWIYSLLVRLDAMLVKEEVSHVRDLGRQLKRIRWIQANNADSHTDSIVTVNILLVIISEVFGQRDLY